MIRVGVVGAGANTRARHLPMLQQIPGVRVTSVCNRRPESTRAVARDFNIPHVYDRWEELVASPQVDAVVIGTWPYLHCAVTIAALEAGKHVLCEARMAMNAAEAHQMLEAARARPNLVAQVVPAPFTLRVDPYVQQLLAEGYLGQLLVANVRGVGSGFIDRESPLHWRQDARLSGLNALTMGIWHESLMRWVGDASRVLARTRTFVETRRDPESGQLVRVRVPDHIDILADLQNGAQANYQFSAVEGLGGHSGIGLFGTEGTLFFDADTDRLLGGRRGDEALRDIPIPPEKEGRWRVEEEFIAAIRGEQPVRLTTFEDGVRTMEFTEAVHRSAESGCAVNLPLERGTQA
ncbi:MAG: Gfo/Idh/MocA family oxidoreductase [Armatimonadota bacterium]|nr:Gfo/Idh/MocA family oxidoreductase [Armatimonadota bacterium]